MKHFELLPGAPPAPTLGAWWPATAVTTIFALFAWLVRGVTVSGACAGAVVALALFRGAGWGGFLALSSVFFLTWAATRVGYRRKQTLGMAEAQKGRDGAQVFANLAIAAGCALVGGFRPHPRLAAALAASLAEAAADTVSSEFGQALGGRPRLVTNWRRVETGTDGAITLLGTLAGTAAAALVSFVCALAGVLGKHQAKLTLWAAVIGMMTDSVLGATLERRGLVGNNTVNLLSTAIAASVALWLA
jgi:uncharacterized protein (TIGR00297 family)